MSRFTCRTGLAVLGQLVFVSALLVSTQVTAATIAYWRFEPGNFTGDSAGSNTLANTGVSSSLDVPTDAPGTGSASFSGTQSIFSTVATLNLTPYADLTVEWFMKSTQSSIATVWEQNSGSGAGAIGSFINDLLPNGVEVFQRGISGTYVEDALRPQDGEWHHFAMTIDGSDSNTATRMSLFIDGIEVGTFNNFNPPSGTPAFQNTTMFIGSRNDSSFKFVGLLDEMRISNEILDPSQFLNVVPVPEPTTFALLGLGVIGMAIKARRRRIAA